MTNEFQFDVFLSHTAKDKAVVRDLAARLQRDGVRVWLDEEQIKPGDSIPAKIEAGLEHSRVLVLCMSANAFGSDWTQLEAGTCGRRNLRFRDPLNNERRFIPCGSTTPPSKAPWRNPFTSADTNSKISRKALCQPNLGLAILPLPRAKGRRLAQRFIAGFPRAET